MGNNAVRAARLETLSLIAELVTVMRVHLANSPFFHNTEVAARNLDRLVDIDKRLAELAARVAQLDG